MQSRDWDELRRLMSIARQQNLLGEALQAVEQGPLAPIPRAKPKPKAKSMATLLCGAGTGGAGTGGMTDASKRRLPDDDEDWEAVEGHSRSRFQMSQYHKGRTWRHISTMSSFSLLWCILMDITGPIGKDRCLTIELLWWQQQHMA